MKRKMSPSRAKVVNEITQRYQHEQPKRPISKSSDYELYCCHFNNGVYMGGMSGYKKHGKGLILHDDGSAVIS